MIDFFLDLMRVFFGFGNDGVEYFSCVFRTDVYDVVGILFEFVPFFLCGV